MLRSLELSQTALEWSDVVPAQFFDERILLRDGTLDIVAMIPVVRERGIDVG